MSKYFSKSSPARVLIVDDHPALCRSLRRHLEQDPTLTVCGVVQQADPDVVLLDLTLGEDDGLSVAREIRSSSLAPSILVLSIHRESLYAESALEAGASGYLEKSDASENLLTALHTVLEGHTYLSTRARDRNIAAPES